MSTNRKIKQFLLSYFSDYIKKSKHNLQNAEILFKFLKALLFKIKKGLSLIKNFNFLKFTENNQT